jgi:hypothetical protein
VLLFLGDDRLTQYVLEGEELAAARAEVLELAMALTG